MAGEAPGWADQWGAGGIGALEDADTNKTTENNNKKNKTETKSGLGFGKAKVAAMVGAEKIKSGTSSGFKWIKNQCQKKKPSKSVTTTTT